MEDLEVHDVIWITKEYYKQALWYFASRYNLKCVCFRYLYEDELNKMTESERHALQDEFDRIRLEAYQVALKGEVKFDIFTYPLRLVLFLLGDSIELRCVRGQAIVSSSSIRF